MITDTVSKRHFRTACIPALFCTLLWGVGYPLVKLGYSAWGIAAGDIPTKLVFAGLRFTVAGLLVILFCSVREKRIALPPRKQWGGITVLGLLQTVLQYACTYVGLAFTTGVKSAVLNQVNVFLLVLISPLIFRSERVTARKVAGCIVGFAGVVIINLKGFSFSFNKGDGFILLASFFAASGYIVSKLIGKNGNGAVIVGWQQLLGGLVLSVAGLVSGGRLAAPTARGTLILLLLSLAAAGAYVLWLCLLCENDVSRVSVYKFATPVFGVLFSGLLLGEAILKWENLLSLLFVSGGILAVSWKGRQKHICPPLPHAATAVPVDTGDTDENLSGGTPSDEIPPDGSADGTDRR